MMQAAIRAPRSKTPLSLKTEKDSQKVSVFKDLKDKKNNKKIVFSKNPSYFTVCFSDEYLQSHEKKILMSLIQGCYDLTDIHIIVYTQNLQAEKQYSIKENIKYKNSKKEALAISDTIFLFPSQTSEVHSIYEFLEYKTVPISFKTSVTRKILNSFDPLQEKGNCFLYERENMWSMFEAIIKAKETYRFSYDWETLLRACVVK